MRSIIVLLMVWMQMAVLYGQDVREGKSYNPAMWAEYSDTISGNFRYGLRRPTGGECFFTNTYNEGIQGYHTGTNRIFWNYRKDLPFGRDTVIATYAAEHGVGFRFPPGPDTLPIYLHQVTVFWGDGTQPVPFNPAGSTHPYHMRLYEISQTNFMPVRTVVEQRFRLQNFTSRFETGEIVDYRIQYPGGVPAEEYWLTRDSSRNYIVTVEVRNPRSPDWLNLIYISSDCIHDSYLPEGGWVAFRDTVNHRMELFGLFPDVFGYRRQYQAGELPFFMHTPFIVPVMVPIRRPTDRPVNLGHVGGLSLQSPFPNPATDFTHLRFSLDRPDEVRLTVLDAAGRRVRSLSLQAPAGQTVQQLEVGDLPCGLYTLLVQSRQGQLGTHLLIER